MKKENNLLCRPIYQIGISILIPFSFYINNFYIFNYQDVILTILLFSLLSILITFTLYLFTGLYKSSLLTFLFFTTFLFPGLPWSYGLFIFILSLTITFFIISKEISIKIHLMLNLFVIFMLSFQLYNFSTLFFLGKTINNNSYKLEEMIIKPDIYHFVLDGYSSQSALYQFYKFDNIEFINKLRDMGFKIYSNATSPYNQTLPTMSSIFNMEYIKKIASSPPASIQMRNWGASSYKGTLPTYLNDNGYNFAFSSNGYGFLSFPENYDINAVNNNIMLSVFFNEIINNTWWGSKLFKYKSNYGIYEKTINALNFRSYERIPKPFFYYAHILSPHPPFNINRNGEITNEYKNFSTSIDDASHATKMDPLLIEEYKKGYIEKLIFTNSTIIKQIEYILKNVGGKKTIIIHGDHGGGSEMNHDHLEKTCVMERYKPLLAVYNNYNEENNNTDKSYSLVNIYRDFISKTSENNLQKLETKTFFIPWGKTGTMTEFDLDKQKKCN